MLVYTGSFYRAAVPQDILAGTPNPSLWGVPAASLLADKCNPLSNYFMNMSIVFGEQFSPNCQSHISQADALF